MNRTQATRPTTTKRECPTCHKATRWYRIPQGYNGAAENYWIVDRHIGPDHHHCKGEGLKLRRGAADEILPGPVIR